MKRRTKFILIPGIIILAVVATLPFWGMGPAVFLDSERAVISRVTSPDGKRTAQVERIVVGGEPSIVVMVRPAWMPDWYLAGCAATSHHQDATARVRWVSNSAIDIRHSGEQRFWSTGSAPFHNEACGDLLVTFDNKRL
ncbi:hypothetical protein PIB19_11210 [Sphingomonas sp. 7/4-4]|uniref:hypothetical protein n=1 Tax=Sphingomonas sp. 7/4-4 TaxID=3018446 RepID=UPI0022F3DBD8|nr:hypothetical protein [Sphingomonas sp. 7/4-4]WBY06214.1 hypothetical protein PIB19_11210 [Sphingomonas sp. 7/4-4]